MEKAIEGAVPVKSAIEVKYFAKNTDMEFLQKDVVDALLGLINNTEIEQCAQRFPGKDMSAPTLYVQTGILKDIESASKRIFLSFSNRKLLSNDERMPIIYMRQSGLWRYVGPLSLTLNNTLNNVARKCGWERMVFADEHGDATNTPSIIMRKSSLGVYLYIPIKEVSSIEFRNISKVSKSK